MRGTARRVRTLCHDATFVGMRLSLTAPIALGAALIAPTAQAASLPEHEPLSIVIVSDEVNPNGLPAPELTQPGDLTAAFENAGSGLNIAQVDEVSSTCVDDAVAALNAGVDVFVYFAHLAATTCDGGDGQGALTEAVRAHLQAGGGVVVFHHGAFAAGGKESMLSLLGATANAIDWQPQAGQSVISTGGDHFVVSNAVEYPEMRTVGNDALGVPMGDYPAFVNTPDERYPGLYYETQAGEERTTLFVSDYGNGSEILGYDLWRPDWAGHVVMYQPGEYQPAALDDLEGNNFQVLANAIYYVATTQEEPSAEGGDDTGATDGPADDTAGDDDPSADDTAGDDNVDETAGDSNPGDAGGTVGGGGSDSTVGVDTDGTNAADGGGDDGCGCRSTPAPSPTVLALSLFGLAVTRRRTRR